MYEPDPWYVVFFSVVFAGALLIALLAIPTILWKRKFYYENFRLDEDSLNRLLSNEFYNYVISNGVAVDQQVLESILKTLHSRANVFDSRDAASGGIPRGGLVSKRKLAKALVKEFPTIGKQDAIRIINLEQQFL